MFRHEMFWLILPWMAFAYENIAKNKSAKQENPYETSGLSELGQASRAFDGLKSNLSAFGGQCTLSANHKKEALLYVDLATILGIHHITVYYRTDNLQWGPRNGYVPRFLGFSVYISNTTKTEDWVLCFKDDYFTNETIPAVITLNCTHHGRYVIYYNNRTSTNLPPYYSQYAYNELCEFEVYGCPSPIYYGENCDLSCPRLCKNRRCHIETGKCFGCEDGYLGSTCQLECQNNTYGAGCSERCGHCLNEKGCDHVNGTCPSGCEAGYYGSWCKIECPPMFYGRNCSQSCSGNCSVSKTCDRKTGVCVGGCAEGSKPPLCNEECDDLSYGRNCSYSCGQCNKGVPCNKKNGRCPSGCASGYEGIYCNKTCAHSYYGPDCNLNCSISCFNQTCDAKSGECLKGSAQDNGENGNSITPVAIGGSIGVLFVVIVAVVVVVCRKRGQQTNQHSQHQPKTTYIDLPPDVDIDEKIHEENPYGNMYANEQFCPDILIKDIGSAIMKKRKDDYDGFKREYASLPYGERYPCDTGRLQVNIPKNRFKTTFPYDHSRVILRKNAGSDRDYINANYIDGQERKNEYIASQGPKESTLGDFWEMVCQDQVKQIIMLTNLREGRKIKCHQYWPDLGNKEIYGTISVKSMEEKQYAFYTLRKFQVSQKSMNSYVVTQFHYTTWPDHGTPDPLCLVIFHSHVTHENSNQDVAPTLVHCSAGIGRTGTYIALDSLYHAGRKSGRVNVTEYVKTMRANRMNMIQTYEQYMTVFLALQEAFKAVPDPQGTVKFCQRISQMLKDAPANYSGLRKEYELLRKVCPVFTNDDYKLAKQNMPKQRKDVILPLDKYGLYLTSNVPTRGGFINAIVASSHSTNNGFIVTHYPTPEDAVDFLRLLIDHESSTVICMDPLHNIDQIKSWLPLPSSEKIVSPFKVVHSSSKDNNVKLSVISIHKDGEKLHKVTVAEPKAELKTQNVHDTSFLRSLISFALSCPNDSPITVVSKDGASLCGVFCAVFNSVQQITMDDNIDVFTTVRQLQTRRPEFCSTQDEYGLIYQTVYDHLQATSENVYFNQ
ncbi:receptor-type tyrosine-protein phosphatase alpha-like [Crassostrea angulata]|uniref:receptor-type tyrosine-protein phosphatase alpha-like n=1 Tax=Magallana angulata TaxID=2784310 RepID=UPI0022B1E32F|nr:receptor-type tyrosine-protein phosphatase alpha-like [Crassostrea angulata]